MTQFSDIVVTPIYGPLYHKYPNIIPTNRPGLLSGIKPSPQQFGFTDGTSDFASARNEYVRATPSPLPYKDPSILTYNTCQNRAFTGSNIYPYLSQRPTIANSSNSPAIQAPAVLVYAKKKLISPQSSALRTAELKRNEIGKSSYKQGLSAESSLGYKNFNSNDARDALRHARSRGGVAPKKKGSIYNTSLTNGKVCSWGSIPRSTY